MTYEFNEDDYQDENDLYYLNGMSYDLEDARERRHNSLISKGFSTESISDYVDEIYNNNNEGEIKYEQPNKRNDL
jgi:hypothetical protein